MSGSVKWCMAVACVLALAGADPGPANAQATPKRGGTALVGVSVVGATLNTQLTSAVTPLIIADLWAVAKLGVGATLGLLAVVSLPRAFVFRAEWEDPHPIPWVRVRLSAALGQALYPHPQWDADLPHAGGGCRGRCPRPGGAALDDDGRVWRQAGHAGPGQGGEDIVLVCGQVDGLQRRRCSSVAGDRNAVDAGSGHTDHDSRRR